MTDNVTLPGTGVAVASDDISGVQLQRLKVTWGPDGSFNDADVASGKPLPVQLRSSVGNALSFSAGATDTGTPRVALASDSPGIDTNVNAGQYHPVAAGLTAVVMGGAGAIGDYISGIIIVPGTLNPGAVTLLDNAISIPIFTGGASSVSNLVPFYVPLAMFSVSGAWKITTGSAVSVIVVGKFT